MDTLVAPSVDSGTQPKGNRRFQGLSAVSYPIGLAMADLVLCLLFFGIIAPIGAIVRATGRDTMRRRFEGTRGSYWSDARPRRSAASYFKQY